MRSEIEMSITHGRKGKKGKTEFKAVIEKILVSGLALSIVIGSATMPAYAVNSQDIIACGSVYTDVMASEGIVELKNTVEALEYLKGMGIVTDEALEKLARTINALELSYKDNVEVEALLDRAEKVIKDVNSKKVKLVEIAIDNLRNKMVIGEIEESYELPKANAGLISFPDVIQGQWFYENVMDLVNMGAINGYPDGTFKPNDTISYAEYLTILVKTTKAGSGNYSVAEGGEWYDGVVDAAIESEIIGNVEIKDYTAPISRAHAAKYTERAVQLVLGEKQEETKGISSKINDYSTFKGTAEEYYILQQYAKGIIVGNDKGNFSPYSNLTRAEASTIILRTVKSENRANISVEADKPTQSQTNPYVIESGTYKGMMKSEYATKYHLEALKTARFYKENGKYYISMDLPELPEGFSWRVGVLSHAPDKVDGGMYTVFGVSNKRTDFIKDNRFFVEITSDIEGISVEDITDTELSVRAVNTEGLCYIYHSIFTSTPNQVYSRFAQTEQKWDNFNTSNIFNW